MIENKLMKELDNFEYGCLDKNGNNIMKNGNLKDEFGKYFHLLSPEELSKIKCGVCLDQVEYERQFFEQNNYKVETYLICLECQNNSDRYHTFLVFYKNNKCYWFEHALESNKGIFEYNNINDLFKDVKDKFYIDQKKKIINYTDVYFIKYTKPKFGINYSEYIKYIYKFKKIIID